MRLLFCAKRFVTVLVCVMVLGAGLCEAVEVVKLPFPAEGQWTFEKRGAYEGWTDRRALFVLFHPWEESLAGAWGQVSREVVIPKDWQERVRLWFYMTDDYHGDHPQLKDTWLMQMSLMGHRFKQVLVNEEVIWERDVGDRVGPREPVYFSALLPEEVRAGSKVQIGFRVIDKVSSTTRLEGDYRYNGKTNEFDEPWRFRTHVYIGDVALSPESLEGREAQEPPSMKLVERGHQKRWPLEPYGQKVEFPVGLTWEGHKHVRGMKCAIRCGIPLPAGLVRDIEQIQLTDADGQAIDVQAAVMNRWRDGSVRWAEIDAIVDAKAGTEQLYLNVDGKGTTATAGPDVVQVRVEGKKAVISTGAVIVEVGGKALIERMQAGEATLSELQGQIEINGKLYQPAIEEVKVLASGPVRGEAELRGQMAAGEKALGRFVFRLSGFAGQPYVRMTWRIFNDRDQTLQVQRFELVGTCDLGEDVIAYWGQGDKTSDEGALVRQLFKDRYEVLNGQGKIVYTAQAAKGWSGAKGTKGAMVTMVRHFREQFPKAIELMNRRVRISLFESNPSWEFFQPTEGEAKRHEVWLGLWDRQLSQDEMVRVGRYFARPSRLFDAEYYCASGGLGYAAVHNKQQFAELDAIIKERYDKVKEKPFYEYGIRDWGDRYYNKDKDQWCNGYYDVQQGFASGYLMTGDPWWFDGLEAAVRHIMDIDVCHASSSRPEWVGSIHMKYARNHTEGAGPWSAFQRTKGMLAYWRLTGDMDALQTALIVADAAIRTNSALGATSIRDPAGTLYCLTAAYDETGQEKYLQAAGRLAHNAMRRVDRRRGCYAEVHGHISYWGNIPWMCAQLAEPMYYYYRQSGDIKAAKTVVGLAESIITENCTRGVPGDIYGYSYNPYHRKHAGYHVLIAPAILYAYELTEDEEFLTHGRTMYRQLIMGKNVNVVNNCYWNTPTMLWYLKFFGLE